MPEYTGERRVRKERFSGRFLLCLAKSALRRLEQPSEADYCSQEAENPPGIATQLQQDQASKLAEVVRKQRTRQGLQPG